LASHIAERLIRGELELEANYWAMQHLSETKNQAMLRATHELKAPLAAIKSYVYTLRDGYAGPLPSRAQEIIERIGRRCDRLLLKISDIIQLANLKSYMLSTDQLKLIDIVPVLTQSVNGAQQIGKMRGIQVTLSIPPGPLMVFATDEHLRTLFGNLLSNAINYSFDNGPVEIRVERQGETLRVSIQDRGIGIPAEAKAKIFEDYYRATNAAAHYDSGSGLGLPIVMATAGILDANLDFDSEVGKGTCFTILFNLQHPAR
jgi:signal transduction histidine kinase